MSLHVVDALPAGILAGGTVAVALPARDEAGSITGCLRALDAAAARAARAVVTVVVLVNNARDATAAVARAFAPGAARVIVAEVMLPPADAHAGGARRAALDRCAALLPRSGVLMTTDADSRVAPDWVTANLAELAAGADAVAGVVGFDAATRAALPPLPAERALEWQLAGLQARLGSLLDPRPHDPWPNHIWAWGASLALTKAAYERIGGLPSVPLAEDRALAALLERHDLRLRRSHAPVVHTSARRAGRAPGGFADLLDSYARDPAALCDAALEPTATLVRRLRLRARLRRVQPAGFGARWAGIEAASPRLARQRLRPAMLRAEVARATRLIAWLEARAADRADSPPIALAA